MEETTNDNEIITVPEAAEIMGLHQSHVRRLIRDGKLPATAHGGIWILKRSDALAFEKSPRGRKTTTTTTKKGKK